MCVELLLSVTCILPDGGSEPKSLSTCWPTTDAEDPGAGAAGLQLQAAQEGGQWRC